MHKQICFPFNSLLQIPSSKLICVFSTMKPFPLLIFSGGVILLPSLLIDIQELSAVQQNIKHERFSNLSMLYLEQQDG